MAASTRMIILTLCLLASTSLFAADQSSSGTVRLAKYEDRSIPVSRKPDLLLEVSEKYQYYDIDGSTLPDLRQKMRTNGTKWNDGRVYAALTTWDIDYHYTVEETAAGCSIRSVTTTVDIIYRLPKWVPAATPPTKMSESWSSYMNSLKVHEWGHKDLAVESASDINRMLASLGTFSSRKELDRQAERLVKARLKEMKEAQVEYDATTHHGVTQGAMLD